MKINLTFKHPDAVFEALCNLSEEEQETAQEVIKKFVEYGEYITVQVDTESETAVVLPV